MSDMLGSPKLALSTVCLSGTLEDKLRATAAAGFAAVEILEYDLVMSPWSPHRVAGEAAALGLSVAAYQPFHIETVPPDMFGAEVRHIERKFDLLSELGAGVLVCCSSRTSKGCDDDELALEQLHAGEACCRGGAQLVLEGAGEAHGRDGETGRTRHVGMSRPPRGGVSPRRDRLMEHLPAQCVATWWTV